MEKRSAPKQQGFAHILVLLLLLAGLGLGVYLVSQKTNFFPKAYESKTVSKPKTTSAQPASSGIFPILYWKLDDGSGTAAVDSSGYSLNGTLLGGPTWTTGKIGGGLSFDGIDDVVNGGNDSRLNTTNETIEFWANLKSASRYRTLLTKGFVAPFPYRFEFDANNRIQFIIHDGLKPGPAAHAKTDIVGGWHHIAGVRDAARKNLYIYIDGVLEGTAYDSTTASTGNSGNLILGGRLPVVGGITTEKIKPQEAKDFIISGIIDDVRIYNTTLDADQIKEDSLLPTPTSTPSPTPIPGTLSRVFVTSTTYNGNLGGLAGADAKCQERANAANLGGIWKAWLSDGTVSAASRLKHSAVPYKRIDGKIVANDWVDLTDGSIQNPIEVTENGSILPLGGGWDWSQVWTNTLKNGEINTRDSLYNCKNWSSGDYRIVVSGPSGGSRLATAEWTNNGAAPMCSVTNTTHLYCFEQ